MIPKYKIFILSLLLLASCDRSDDIESAAKIDAGIGIDQSSANKADAVFHVSIRFGGSQGACTGTAVSTDTILFAAHCVEGGGWTAASNADATVQANTEVCVSNATMQNVCTDKVYVPKKYTNNDPKKMAYDVAVAIFEGRAFEAYADVYSSPTKVGDEVVLVGYSPHNIDPNARSTKRWGRNKIQEHLSGITIVSSYNGTSDGVGVSPGDSGGPLFIGCAVAGVASRMAEHSQGKEGLHTNMTWGENQNWLREQVAAVGGHVCGLGTSGNASAGSEFCPHDKRFQPLNNSDYNTFPCGVDESADNPSGDPVPIGIAIVSDTQDQRKVQLYIGVDASLDLSGQNAPKVCLVKDPKPTSAAADCLESPLGAAKLGDRKSGGLTTAVMKVSSAVQLPADDDKIGLLITVGSLKTVVEISRK